MQINIKLIKIALFTYLAQGGLASANNEIKLLDYVKNDLRSWISVNESVSIERIRLFITPERTFPGCPSKLKLRKSERHKNTIKISCDDSKWMTEIRYTVTQEKKSYLGYIFQKNLPEGHKIGETDIEMSLFEYTATSFEQDPENIIGKFTAKYSAKGERVRKNSLAEPVKVLLVTKFIPKGKVIETSEIKETEVGVNKTNPQNQLLASDVIGAKANKNIPKETILSESHISLAYQAIATKERIMRNSLITIDNTTLKRFWGRKPSGVLTSIKNLKDVEASRSLRRGEILKINDLRPAKLVNKGDIVTLNYELNSLQLIISLESLEDGRLGEKIRLRNNDSGEIIKGKVTGKGTVDMWR